MKARWKLSDNEFEYAVRYITNNMPDLDITKISDPVNLTEVIYQHLDAVQIQRLRTSIRVEKTRKKKTENNKKDVQLTLTPKAHSYLKALACERDMTISEAVERYVGALCGMDYEGVEDIADKWQAP